MKHDFELRLQEKSLIIQSLALRVRELSKALDEGVLVPVGHEDLDDNYQLLVTFVHDYDAEIATKGVVNLPSGRDLVKKVTNNEVEIHTP